tara:strand:+ start:1343 stop:1948 length:606 start_codon:yes stop_codon:yes gene_type:complete
MRRDDMGWAPTEINTNPAETDKYNFNDIAGGDTSGVSVEEFSTFAKDSYNLDDGVAQSIFDKTDTNGDKSLSKDEFKAAFDKLTSMSSIGSEVGFTDVDASAERLITEDTNAHLAPDDVSNMIDAGYMYMNADGKLVTTDRGNSLIEHVDNNGGFGNQPLADHIAEFENTADGYVGTEEGIQMVTELDADEIVDNHTAQLA